MPREHGEVGGYTSHPCDKGSGLPFCCTAPYGRETIPYISPAQHNLKRQGCVSSKLTRNIGGARLPAAFIAVMKRGVDSLHPTTDA
jgi:hypothetical protein